MEHSGKVLLELFFMFAGGKLLAEVFERFRQPGVLGELLAGCCWVLRCWALFTPMN